MTPDSNGSENFNKLIYIQTIYGAKPNSGPEVLKNREIFYPSVYPSKTRRPGWLGLAGWGLGPLGWLGLRFGWLGLEDG